MMISVNVDFAENKNSYIRKAFVHFAQEAIQKFPLKIFTVYWWDYFIALAKDKVPAIRMLFLKSLPHIKTFFTADLDMHH